MKTSIKIALLVIIALIVIAASRSGQPEKVNPAKGCYSRDEVQLLMDYNGWSKQEAVQALELSCEYAVTPK